MELSFKLEKNANIIFDYLTDMQKFVTVHPAIFKINKTGNGSYSVHEKLKLGFAFFTFTYPVIIEKNQVKKNIIIHATIMKLVKIMMQFTLITEYNFTIVEESITFKSILPVKLLMQRIFRKQHIILFRNIEQQAK